MRRREVSLDRKASVELVTAHSGLVLKRRFGQAALMTAYGGDCDRRRLGSDRLGLGTSKEYDTNRNRALAAQPPVA